MTATSIEQFGLAAAADDLSAHMQGRVVTAGDVAYSDVRSIRNGAVTHEPALFLHSVKPLRTYSRSAHLPFTNPVVPIYQARRLVLDLITAEDDRRTRE